MNTSYRVKLPFVYEGGIIDASIDDVFIDLIPAQQWLDSTRLMPEDGKRVLVSDGKEIVVRFLSEANDGLLFVWWNPDGDGWQRLKRWKWWQPLPKLPNVEKQSG